MILQTQIVLNAYPKGFHLITNEIVLKLPELPENGILNLFLKHTSAALTINENADKSVRDDFETFFSQLVPENFKQFTHIYEGKYDMPAHIKSSLLGGALMIPISNYHLNLGTWQGIYLCEFREYAGKRTILATIIH